MKSHNALIEKAFLEMNAAVIVTDKAQRVVSANPAAERILGISDKAVKGKPLKQVLTPINPDTQTPIKIPSTAALSRGRDLVRVPAIVLREDGQETVFALSCRALKSEQGAVEGILIELCTAIMAASQMRESIAERKTEAIGSVVDSIAQDFTNHLSGISGHAAAIVDSVLPKTRVCEDANRIMEITQHASSLAKRLLSIAHATQNDDQAPLESTSLGDAITEAIRVCAPVFARRHVTVEVRNPSGMPWVNASAARLLDCLINLLHDAGDALGKGGRILLETRAQTIASRPFVVLSIRQTGNGSDKRTATQAKDPDTTPPVGLTIVRSIVEHWGGQINVRVAGNSNAIVRILLPRQKPTGDRASRAASRKVQAAEVLIMDDNATFLQQMADWLTEGGYKVHAARNPTEGVHLFKKYQDRIRATVIDVIMPRRDGRAVLDDILALNPAARVVMISGFSRDFVRGYIDRGAWEFVQKPFEQEHFLNVIGRLIEQP